MKNTIKILGIIVFYVVIGFLMSTCEMPEEDQGIVGTWVCEESGPYVLYDKHTLKFESSGKLIISYSGITSGASEYTWEVNDSILTIDDTYLLFPITAEYSIKGKELTISNSSNATVLYPATYTKQ